MIHYPNIDDFEEGFWDTNYKILVSSQGIEFHVNADCTGDAIDYVIDYCEEHCPGLLWDDEQDDIDYQDDYICGGNHGRYFSTYNVLVKIMGDNYDM